VIKKHIKSYEMMTSVAKLSNEEINQLVIKYQKEKNENKKEEISNLIVEQYIKMVIKLANKFAGAYSDINDAINNGIVGLYDAMEKYDPNRKAAFGTFAFTCIHGFIYDGYQYAFFKLPRHVKHSISVLNRAERAKQASGDNSISLYECMDAKDKQKKFIKKFIKSKDGIIKVLDMNSSYSVGSKSEKNLTLEERVACQTPTPEENVLNGMLTRKIMDIINDKLSEREKLVLRRRYFDASGDIKTLQEIGKEMDITFEAVRLIEKAATKKIRDNLNLYK
jgi:RNA polymerase sigma factor (sigma-70 family)